MRTLLNALLIGGGILLVGGMLSGRLSFIPMFTGLVATGSGLVFISLCAVLSLLAMLMLFQVQKGLLIYFVLGCSPILAAVAIMGVDSFKLPLIHDISTDLIDPPEFEFARVGRGRYDNSLNHEGKHVSEQQAAAYPDIAPRQVAIKPMELLPTVEEVAQSLGWKLIGSDEFMLRVEAQESSLLFGFVDDVVIRLTDTPYGSRVDVRSVSRMGRGDFGANAKRIRRFYESLCAVPGTSCKALQDIEKADGNSDSTEQKSVDSISPDS